MAVAELIRILETHPAGLRAMAQGYEEGFDDLEAGCAVAGVASLIVNSAWYCRRHEQVLSGDKLTRNETVWVLFQRRPWHDDGA